MARGTTLVKLLDGYRIEAKLSLNPAHNAQSRDPSIGLLQRVQEWLWEDFTWPHLRVERYVVLQAGQRYYELPTDLHIDRIEKIEVKFNTLWQPVHAGIDECHMNEYDSQTGERAWPVRRWKISEDEQIEVWPIPEVDGDDTITAPTEDTTYEGVLKITGIRKLRPLVADADRADLDDRIIQLYAAAETLAGSNAKLSQIKLTQANNLYARLRGNLTPRRKYKMFGRTAENKAPLRGPPSIYYRVEDP